MADNKAQSACCCTASTGGGGTAQPVAERHPYLNPSDCTTKKLRPSIKFDAMMFIIIVILGYLLSYRLTSYLAEFKIDKHYSRIDIVFLAICALLIYVPMSHISNAKKSDVENRNLAVWKPLITQNGEINYNFGKDYDTWFNDRFNLRDLLINLYFSILYNINTNYETSSYIVNKEFGFVYTKKSNSVRQYLRNNLFTDSQLSKLKQNLEALNNYCNKNNVKLFVFLSMDKESLYPEYYPKYYMPLNSKTRYEQVQDVLSEVEGLEVISTKQELFKRKQKDLVMLRGDTHNSPVEHCSLGSYIEYSVLMSKIRNFYKNVRVLTEADFNKRSIEYVGDIIKGSYISHKSKYKEQVVVFQLKEPKARKIYSVVPDKNNKSVNIAMFENKQASNNLNVVIIGDSFHARYRSILAENFERYTSVFIGDGRDYILTSEMKEIVSKGGKPDILIIETTERFLQRFLKMDSFMDIFDKKYVGE